MTVQGVDSFKWENDSLAKVQMFNFLDDMKITYQFKDDALILFGKTCPVLYTPTRHMVRYGQHVIVTLRHWEIK